LQQLPRDMRSQLTETLLSEEGDMRFFCLRCATNHPSLSTHRSKFGYAQGSRFILVFFLVALVLLCEADLFVGGLRLGEGGDWGGG